MAALDVTFVGANGVSIKKTITSQYDPAINGMRFALFDYADYDTMYTKFPGRLSLHGLALLQNAFARVTVRHLPSTFLQFLRYNIRGTRVE
jgi:hypothetical protein